MSRHGPANVYKLLIRFTNGGPADAAAITTKGPAPTTTAIPARPNAVRDPAACHMLLTETRWAANWTRCIRARGTLTAKAVRQITPAVAHNPTSPARAPADRIA